jgi:hypothetical protein
LGQALVNQGVIDELQLSSALASVEQWGQRLPQALLHLRLVREDTLVEAISKVTKTEKVDLSKRAPEPSALAKLEASYCQEHGLIPLSVHEGGRLLHLALSDPTDLQLIDQITNRTRARIIGWVAGEAMIQKAIRHYYFGLEVSWELAALEKPISELEELKLVNSSGKTIALTDAVVSLKQAMKAQEVAVATAPAPIAIAFEKPEPVETEEGNGKVAQLNQVVATLKKQLAQARRGLDSNQAMLRAVIDLLEEKRYLTRDEVRAQLAKGSRGTA